MTKKNSFCHSGAFGDLIYSLPIVKHTGGGDFYLHLNQMNWIGNHYYGNDPVPYHRGRLNEQDFKFMKSFMNEQDYITSFNVLDEKKTEISHNLDRFRTMFASNPGNYVDTYSIAFGVLDPSVQQQLRDTPWLTVTNPQVVQDRPVAVNRTVRWITDTPGEQWQQWRDEGASDLAFFLGLPQEYQEFKAATGWDIPHQTTSSMLEMAQYIKGAEQFIGNQSMCLALAIGLGTEQVFCEARQDLPKERNECYFPDLARVNYF